MTMILTTTTTTRTLRSGNLDEGIADVHALIFVFLVLILRSKRPPEFLRGIQRDVPVSITNFLSGG
jgi:hypothetical protein